MNFLKNLWDKIYWIGVDFYWGKWDFGIGWWEGSAKFFECSCTYYDGNWYGFRLGPFHASCSPW